MQIRSEFDEMLLRHAPECGAVVIEEHKVSEIHFHEGRTSDGHRPRAITYACPFELTGQISFNYLIDASCRNGMMSTKVRSNFSCGPGAQPTLQ